MKVYYRNIPTYIYEENRWTSTDFSSQEEFADFLLKETFKECGEYGFDESTKKWNIHAQFFDRHKYYTDLPIGSRDRKNFWNKEKKKCRVGVIWKHKDKTWFTTPDYYLILNFLHVPGNKEKGQDDGFCSIRDAQYHMSLYDYIAAAKNKHAATLKRRQCMSSTMKMARFIGILFFEKSKRLKLLGYKDDYITGKHGSWAILEFFRDFLNQKTDWVRGFLPEEVGEWEQKRKVKRNGKTTYVGRRSSVIGKTLNRDPKSGIGGATYIAFYEECFGLGTKVLMFDGTTKSIEDIKVGEFVMGINGDAREVKKISKGEDTLYKITQQKGEPYVVNSKHILVLEQKCNSKNYKDDGLKYYTPKHFLSIKNRYKRQTTYGFKSSGLIFDYQDVPLNPYFLGVWLGDGSKNSAEITINEDRDEEIQSFLNDYSESLGLEVVKRYKKPGFYSEKVSQQRITSRVPKSNFIKEKLRELGVYSYKRIPSIYLRNTKEVRLALLAGLIDTDGYLTKGTESYNFSYEISVTNKELAEDVTFLCRSLGFYVKVSTKKGKTSITKSGHTIVTKDATRITIRGCISEIPVKVERKKVPSDWSPTSNPLNTRIGVEEIGRGSYIGITLEGNTEAERLFLLSDFTVVHNCGVAPTMKETFQFITPAMESGTELVGQFVAAGTVGDLIQCKPLEDMIKHPDAYNVLKVPTKFYDSTGIVKECGLFIPAQFGMPQFVDEYGNSMVEEALEYLRAEDEFKRANLNSVEYNQWKSQNPTTIEEAFQYREDLYFPADIIKRKQDQLKEVPPKVKEGILIEREGEPVFIPLSDIKTNVPREMGFPVDPKEYDKRGVVRIYEEPQKNTPFFVNFAGVDSIKSNITGTSTSLFSIYIIRRAIRRHYLDDNGNKVEKYEPKKILASYTGRYDDLEDTNKVGELLIRMYNAFAACERNEPSFINHMRRSGFEMHIMKRKDLPLFKDVDSTGLSNDEFGIYFGSDSKAEEIMNAKIKEELQFVYDVVYKKDSEGNITHQALKKTRGVDYTNDYYLLEELKLWYHGLNTDRRVGYGLALMAADSYEMSYEMNIDERPKVTSTNRQRGMSLLPTGTTTIKGAKKTRTLL